MKRLILAFIILFSQRILYRCEKRMINARISRFISFLTKCKKVAAVGSDFRKHSPVTLIINLTTSIDTMDAPGKTRVSRFRVRDSQNPTQLAKMKEYLGQAVEAAREEIAGGGTVLVHCHMGKHRSASVAAAYLIRMTGCTVEAAVRSIRFCTRGHAFDSSTLHFGDILDSFHHECSRNKVDGP